MIWLALPRAKLLSMTPAECSTMRNVCSYIALAGCLALQGCIPVRNTVTYWTVSGGGTRGTPIYEYDGGGCTSDHRPRYMNFALAQGVVVSYGFGYGLQGHIFVPPGVTARFIDGIAIARTDSGAEYRGTIVGLQRRLYGADAGKLSSTAPLIGWTRDELLQHVQYDRGQGPEGDGSAQILTWNEFDFGVHFQASLDPAFTVRLPALEIAGQVVGGSELRFSKQTSAEWTLEPCV